MIPPESPDTLRHASAGFRLLASQEFTRCFGAEPWTDGRAFDEVMARAQEITGGRGPNWILELPDRGRRIRIRPCRHGGIFGSWLGDRSWGPRRVLREFSTWITLCRRKIPLVTPVFAISRRRGLFWHSAFASIERDNARDGLAWLAENPTAPQITAVCIAISELARRLHDAGAIHGDLQIRNLLIGHEGCRLIDLDRTRVVEHVSPRQRVRELLRFARSLEKTGHGELASRRYRALALSAYCGEDRRLRRSMMRWSQFEALGLFRHRIAWRIGRLTR